MGIDLGNINSVQNLKNTPGLYTDTFAFRPSATSVNYGTVFFAIDTGAIYQSDGTNWIANGVASPQTLQQVLTTGSTLTQNNTVINSGNEFKIRNIDAINNTIEFFCNNIACGIVGNDVNMNRLCGFQIAVDSCYIYGTDANFGIGYADVTQILTLGAFNSTTSAMNIQIDKNGQNISFYGYDDINAISIRTFLNSYNVNINDFKFYLGDVDSNTNGFQLQIDVFNKKINTTSSGSVIGFDIDVNTGIFNFGDFVGNNSLLIDSSNNQVNLQSSDHLEFIYDNKLFFSKVSTGANAITANSHSATPSPKYLKVNVQGVDYVIELLNP